MPKLQSEVPLGATTSFSSSWGRTNFHPMVIFVPLTFAWSGWSSIKKKKRPLRGLTGFWDSYSLFGGEPQVIIGSIGNKITFLLALEGFIQLQSLPRVWPCLRTSWEQTDTSAFTSWVLALQYVCVLSYFMYAKYIYKKLNPVSHAC